MNGSNDAINRRGAHSCLVLQEGCSYTKREVLCQIFVSLGTNKSRCKGVIKCLSNTVTKVGLGSLLDRVIVLGRLD